MLRKIRVASAGGIIAGGGYLVQKIATAGIEHTGSQIAFHVFGVNTDGTFNYKRAIPVWAPILGGLAISAIAAEFGLNKHMPLGLKL